MPMPPALLIPLILGGLLAVALAIRRRYGKVWLFSTIFGTDTPAGKAFDVALLVAIVVSVLLVVVESDPVLRVAFDRPFDVLEWFFTLLFTLEYLLRLLCVGSPLGYARSFFGIVDLLSIVPSFLGLLVSGAHVFLVVRMLRVMRVFRVLEAGRIPAGIESPVERDRGRPSQDVGVSAGDDHPGDGDRLGDVCDRGARTRFPKHPGGDLLGHRDDHHRGLRRRDAGNPPGPFHGLGGDAAGLQHHRRSHRHHHRRDRQRQRPPAGPAGQRHRGLRGLSQGGARS